VKKKIVIPALLAVSMGSSWATGVADAKWTHGYSGQSAYQRTGSCAYGDRAGGEYVQALHDGMVGNNLADTGTVYRDNQSWSSDLTGSFADSKQFFAFAGHGLDANAIGNGKGAASHFYTLNSSTQFHSSHSDDAANAQWDEIRWGSNGLRWATMYQCNFLRNLGSTANDTKILNMFKGMRLMMGFASIMYLDSREGGRYAARIGAGWTLKDSFFDAAAYYQPALKYGETNPTGKVIARVVGPTSLGGDKWDSSTGAGLSFNGSNASSFTTWTKEITINP